MAQAIITDGFVADSTEVTVVAEAADATVVLVYDDTSIDKGELLGTGEIEDSIATVTLSAPLYAGQRIIAYLNVFGDGTLGSVTVAESDKEYTGWKVPTAVEGVPYADYLTAGGVALPEMYAPEECRNTSRDLDFVSDLLSTPITFVLRQIETQAGTIQVIVERIKNAIGGAIIKFDSDTPGTTAAKTYDEDGSYQVKIWSGNQTEADAIVMEFDLTMPTAVTTFGTEVYDLAYDMDYGNGVNPGTRPINVIGYGTVPMEFKIDGVSGADWQTGTLAQTREYRMNAIYLTNGLYTIRARKAADGTQELSREIKIAGI